MLYEVITLAGRHTPQPCIPLRLHSPDCSGMTSPIPDIKANLQSVRERIRQAATASGRNPDEIRLIAVSKTVSSADIIRSIDAGQHIFGESTVQDAMTKLTLMKDPANEWHFIGHLQTNVITSYSIHYTKLYETRCAAHAVEGTGIEPSLPDNDPPVAGR